MKCVCVCECVLVCVIIRSQNGIRLSTIEWVKFIIFYTVSSTCICVFKWEWYAIFKMHNGVRNVSFWNIFRCEEYLMAHIRIKYSQASK